MTRATRPWWYETGTPTFLLKLLRERNYAKRYRAEGVTVVCVSIEFSKATRRIVAWDVEPGGARGCVEAIHFLGLDLVRQGGMNGANGKDFHYR